MARKHPGDFTDVGSSPESDEVGFGVGFEAQLGDGLKSSEDTYSGDPEESENVDYDSVMKDYAAIKVLKRKLALGLSRLHGKGFSCPNDAFARFSMAGFSSVIDALTADNKKVIEDYGFGSLLQFDKCTVPDSFAKWVVGLINYRSGDIISNGKVISLTKETVNLVLGIPLTEKPFPRNSSSGISVVLAKFNKKSVPSVSFFANKLLQHEPMSDEDVFICFIIVAMNNFLCPTNSDIPCIKICVWKGSMIKQYCNIDMKSTGCYGSHPLVETSHSCYSKDLRNLYTPMPSCSDAWFNSRLDEYAGCKLPSPLKVNLWKLVQKYCLDSGLSINMDVQSFNAMPDDMKLTFCKLLQHAYSVDSRSQKLVLYVIKLFSQPSNEDFSATSEDKALSSEIDCIQQTHIDKSPAPSNEQHNLDNLVNVLHSVMSPQCEDDKTVHISDRNAPSTVHQGPVMFLPLQKNHLHLKINCLAILSLKSVSFSPQGSSYADVSMLENLNFYAPDSLSPVFIPGLRRFNPDKKAYLSRMFSPTDIYDLSNEVKSSSSQFNHQVQSSHVQVAPKASPEVQILSERILPGGGRGMVKNSDVLYNSELTRPQSTIHKPSSGPGNTPSSSRALLSNPAPSSTQRARESTTFGKLLTAVDKRLAQPVGLVGGQDVSKCVKYHVSKSETLNYKAICRLAFSQYQGEDAVYLYGVRCTFWSLGESLKPDGQNFDEADEDVISRAFKRLSKTRPVTHSNMLFFPSFYDDHWFVFVVDIKQRKYVMLHSLYKEDDDYQLYVSQKMALF
ncbi:unnamed protein product [Urochloa decumbens]|uniref:Ubiquitin-like protease family profile domain-containing protein n=1 Tax=Urochloa decumbens TaxID=240449 RepID=A0ABC9CL97_9POAL